MVRTKVVWVMWADEKWQYRGYIDYFGSDDQRFDFSSTLWVFDEKFDPQRAFKACEEADVVILFFHPNCFSNEEAINFCSRLRGKGIKIISNDFLVEKNLADFDYLRTLCLLPRVLAERIQQLVAS